MKHHNGISCQGCVSMCHNYQRIFRLNNYAKGVKLIVPDDKNYLLFIESGSVSVEGLNQEKQVFGANEMILFARKDTYLVCAEEESRILSLAFVRAASICDKLKINDASQLVKERSYAFHSLAMKEPMTECVRSICRYISSDISCMYMEESKELELFIIFRHYYSVREIADFFYPVIDNQVYFRSLVQSNLVHAKTVNELAEMCGYSIHSFKKIFVRHFGQAPYQWMLQQKSKLIKRQLLERDIPIKVIVKEFGFTSQSHLNLFCKRYLGGTSLQIRKGIGG